MDGVPVYEARLRMGETLAKKILREYPDHDIGSSENIINNIYNIHQILRTVLSLPYISRFSRSYKIRKICFLCGVGKVSLRDEY